MKKTIISVVTITIILVATYFIYTSKISSQNKISQIKDTIKIIEEPNLLYGLNIDSFSVKTGKIEDGMFLGTLFEKYNISDKLYNIVQKCDTVFDVRHIKSGQNYSVFFSKDSIPDSLKTPKYIIYEKNKVDYIVFDLNDSLNVYSGKKDVVTKIKETAGEIKTSLWFAMEDAGVKPILANDLSEIYAWSIDFFGLQKGDRFKIIYEEKFVNDSSIGYGKIISSYFEHYHDSIYAIPFKQDSVESFFDLEGNSLRKAFLKAPLKFSRISSGFSYARKHPILKIVRPHLGVDYAAPEGTPVHALGDGVVIKKTYTRGGGNYIKIKHNSVYSTGYMHLKGFAKGIKVGTRVSQGQVIGYVGKTGLATGPHLDFRVWQNGKNINPLHIKAPPVEPIKEENKEAFEIEKIKYKGLLDSIEFKIFNDTLSTDSIQQNK
ncbi:MAG: peptidoglycan DD-metalloendopeptidase family protein [Chlorobi bacterium]|nr:peptidoglycan DD-metalloendopeptidase family protein [Chlorobiota bacterium]